MIPPYIWWFEGDQKLLLANSYNMQRRSWKCELKNKQKSPMKKDSISVIKLWDSYIWPALKKRNFQVWPICTVLPIHKCPPIHTPFCLKTVRGGSSLCPWMKAKDTFFWIISEPTDAIQEKEWLAFALLYGRRASYNNTGWTLGCTNPAFIAT